jgi:hypothetical protein
VQEQTKTTDSPGTLNGQQMSALHKNMSDKLAGIVKDVELRKWAVDQACGLAGAAYEGEAPTIEVVALARAIHAFLTEGVTISS